MNQHSDMAGPHLPPPAEIRSIVCLMLGEIGDLVVVLPTIEALRERYPDARVTLIIRGFLADLVRADPRIDELFLLRAKTPVAKVAFVARLALRRWDMWVDLHTPTFNTVSSNGDVFRRNARLMKAAGCRFRLGFAMPETARYLTHARPSPGPATLAQENIVETTARLVGGASRPKRMFVPAADHAEATRLLVERNAANAASIALFFGAKQDAKVWPYENVARFIALLAGALPGLNLLLVGGPAEAALFRRLAGDEALARPARLINLIGASSLGVTMALLSRCRAAVMTDSGPMHIADALGIPLVALFSAHNHPVWHPTAPRSVVLRELVECGPCFKATCPKENLCMSRITPEAVLHRLLPMLGDLTA